MTQAAVPKYLDSDFRTAPPGHRFELYFRGWEANWRKPQSSLNAFKAIGDNPPPVVQRITSALRARQMALESPDSASFGAISSSPFMTGMGIEHPLENGFAFLKPYGIPYLPGSSVKGVLRRAAEELALALFGESLDGWNILHVWSLFGFEASSVYLAKPDHYAKQAPDLQSEAERWRKAYAEHIETLDKAEANAFIERLTGRQSPDPLDWLRTLSSDGGRLDALGNRGALMFSDVFPLMPNSQMGVDILSPHYGDYYQKGGTPNDAGSPVPAMFLTVPEKSEFLFSVQRDPSLLPASLQETWIEKTEALFQYAFDWLGFGAKTAVGYGVMEEDPSVVPNPVPAPPSDPLDELKEWLEEDRANQTATAGGRLANRLAELTAEAATWPQTKRNQLAALAEAIYQLIGWGNAKKKREKKARIDQLRKAP
jgi:CRISPR-associated protein Cmr6